MAKNKQHYINEAAPPWEVRPERLTIEINGRPHYAWQVTTVNTDADGTGTGIAIVICPLEDACANRLAARKQTAELIVHAVNKIHKEAR